MAWVVRERTQHFREDLPTHGTMGKTAYLLFNPDINQWRDMREDSSIQSNLVNPFLTYSDAFNEAKRLNNLTPHCKPQ